MDADHPGHGVLIPCRFTLADQVKSIDRRARGLQVAGSAPASVLAEVRAKVAALLQIDA